ncbi:RecQ family ATP-dependent DNA helicase [bacterium]|nr:RecQ family ATP-dependent DNA helicase [bacterium]
MNRQDPKDILNKVFGFNEFREGQEKVINSLLSGNSTLAVFPTGSGKSLCYQLPAILLDGLTLVISPLIALMKDQVDFLQTKGIKAARLDSSLDFLETSRIYEQLRKNELKLLLVAPERLSNERFLSLLGDLKIDLMVIDEVHCISEWGHNFRPDYLKLARSVESLKIPVVLGLTATATQKVAKNILSEFHIAKENYVNTGFYRPNLTIRMTSCEMNQNGKIDLLVQRIKSHPSGPTIVYVTLQKTAEWVASCLQNKDLNAQAYHAGKKSEQREKIQDWFMSSENAIVVATIAFGMGIDKSNIRYVYHYNLPKSLENYSQEIGRAGRDGLASFCEALITSEDMINLENFVYGDTPDASSIHQLVDHILAQPTEFSISIYDLSNRFDMRSLVTNTFLTYLELFDVIESIAPYYDSYKFKPNLELNEIAQKFDPQRTRFLNQLFAESKKAKIWWHADLDEISAKTGEPRDRLVKAFTYLEEKGFLELNVTGLKQRYRMKPHSINREDLKNNLTTRFYESEKREIKRLNEVIKMANFSGCRIGYLLSYFGETFKRECGHCDWCLGEKASSFNRIALKINDFESIKESITEMKTMCEETPTVRQITRFLCGINSPFMTMKKLKHSAKFGSFQTYPFEQVLTTVESEVRKLQVGNDPDPF